jgi:hypothetical protein
MTYKTNSGSNVWGIDSAKTDGSGSNIGVYPQTAVAIPDRIQGIAIANSTIVLSQSYGLSPSHLLTYKYSSTASSYLTDSSKTLALTKNDKTVFEVPVSFLTEQVNDYEIPCMSEGLCTNGSKVYVLFESGATKYRTFVRERLTNVYSFTPAKKDS